MRFKIIYTILTILLGSSNFAFSQILFNKTIPTADTVNQIGCNSEEVVYSFGDSTYFCYYGSQAPQIAFSYASKDISFLFGVGHDTLSVISWSGTLTLFYGNNDSVFNDNYSYPINFPVRSIGVNGDGFNNQFGDTIYVLNSYNVANDQWNILRISNGISSTLGSVFYDPELVNYIDLDYLQVGTNKYIAIVKPNDLMLYNLETKQYISTGITNITSFQYFDSGGNAYYSIGGDFYRINSISGSTVSSQLIYSMPIGKTINEFSIGQNGTVWVAANDGVYSTHSSGVGILENTLSNTVNLYPNPSSGIFKIEASSEIRKIILLDINGKELDHFSLQTTTADLEIHQNSGFYLLKIIFENGSMETQKIYIL